MCMCVYMCKSLALRVICINTKFIPQPSSDQFLYRLIYGYVQYVRTVSDRLFGDHYYNAIIKIS